MKTRLGQSSRPIRTRHTGLAIKPSKKPLSSDPYPLDFYEKTLSSLSPVHYPLDPSDLLLLRIHATVTIMNPLTT